MSVLRPDSSKKTRRRASTVSWNLRHSSRLLATSSRSCSLACKVFFKNIPHFASNLMKSRYRALLSRVIPEFAERGIRILFNISCQLFQLLWSENGTSVSSRQRSEPSLATCANPSANSFDVIAKNIRKLLPAGATRQIRLCNNRTDFRTCYLHAESLANFYNLSMLNCTSKIVSIGPS